MEKMTILHLSGIQDLWDATIQVWHGRSRSH